MKERLRAVDILRDDIWLRPSIFWYYRQNLIFFCRKDNVGNAFPADRILNKDLLTRVHPEMLLTAITKFWPFMYGDAYYEEVHHYQLLASAWLRGDAQLPSRGHRASAAVSGMDSIEVAAVAGGNEDEAVNTRVFLESPVTVSEGNASGPVIRRRLR